MVNFSFIVLMMCMLSGCASHREVSTAMRDSVRVEIFERRVVVHDTVIIEIPPLVERVVARDSSTLTNPLACSKAVIQSDGTLFHSLETIAQSIEYPIENRATVRDSIVYTVREVVKRVEVPREFTQWQEFRLYGFWLLAALLLLVIYLK